ncbi:hypothetical protein BpHYR1_043638 [Brachionus plicatilis]|uniref:Uncharacterized protein n=1 Tax=Brachionus plicatilis TaxID=10195 RepID=A0A3M7RLB5_BRAPC|nr:hypothetical protein BpHYR1_043638 [Brachionus plicatilis]
MKFFLAPKCEPTLELYTSLAMFSKSLPVLHLIDWSTGALGSSLSLISAKFSRSNFWCHLLMLSTGTSVSPIECKNSSCNFLTMLNKLSLNFLSRFKSTMGLNCFSPDSLFVSISSMLGATIK